MVDASAADRAIAVLKETDDALVAFVQGLSAEQIRQPSGASEWTVAQVLSHLGSGGEISLAGARATLAGDAASPDIAPPIWARYDAMSPDEQRDAFLGSVAQLDELLGGVDAETRATAMARLHFLPAPIPFATTVSMRLNEVALHAWDVYVAFDPAATLPAAATELLVDWESPFFSYLAKGEAIGREATVVLDLTDPVRTKALHVGASTGFVEPSADADGLLHAPAEAWLRLASGRLDAAHTPADVSLASDSVTLDDLRTVFPGF